MTRTLKLDLLHSENLKGGGLVSDFVNAVVGAYNGESAIIGGEGDGTLGESTLNTSLVDNPLVDKPLLDSPLGDAPLIDSTLGDAPLGDAPLGDAPLVDAPIIDTPLVEAPLVDAQLNDLLGNSSFNDSLNTSLGETPLGEPSLGEPSLGEPSLGEPLLGEPSLGEPSLGEPSLGEPSLGEPSLGEPSIGEPSLGEPLLGEPSLGEPSLGEPSLGEPSIGEPSLGEPSLGELHTIDSQYPDTLENIDPYSNTVQPISFLGKVKKFVKSIFNFIFSVKFFIIAIIIFIIILCITIFILIKTNYLNDFSILNRINMFYQHIKMLFSANKNTAMEKPSEADIKFDFDAENIKQNSKLKKITKENNILKKTLSEKKKKEKDLLKKEVFNVDKNLFTYNEADQVCKALNGELASEDQIKSAWENGANWCNYGWSKNGLALYPIQEGYYNNLKKTKSSKKNQCGYPGVNGGKLNPNLKLGVNCYGIKPLDNILETCDDIKDNLNKKFKDNLKLNTFNVKKESKFSK